MAFILACLQEINKNPNSVDYFFLKQDETSSLKFEIRATAFPEPHPKVIELNKDENIVHVRSPS